MPRSVNSVAAKAKRKKVIKAAKGYFGRRKNVHTIAKNAVEKGMQYAYRDRKNKKRTFRSLWISRINAGAKDLGISYSRLINQLDSKSITLNRKILSEIAISDKETFKKVVEKAIT